MSSALAGRFLVTGPPGKSYSLHFKKRKIPPWYNSIILRQRLHWGFPGGSSVKNLPANAGDSAPLLGQGDLEKEIVICSSPRKSRGQKSLVGYRPRGHKELNMTERLNNSKAS